MDQLREKAEIVGAALKQALCAVEAEPFPVRSRAGVFSDYLRDQARYHPPPDGPRFDGDLDKATDGQLLIYLGYTDDEEGRADFQDDYREFLSIRFHNQKMGHICSDYCPNGHGDGGDAIEPTTEAERAEFLDDVRRHLGWAERQGISPEYAPVALYKYVKKYSRLRIPALLAAYTELRIKIPAPKPATEPGAPQSPPASADPEAGRVELSAEAAPVTPIEPGAAPDFIEQLLNQQQGD